MSFSPFRHTDSIQTLRLLVEVARTGQLTQAAAKFGLSVSSASRQLARLREDFHEPLFIRSRNGLVPTVRLQQIVKDLEPILEGIDRLGHDRAFDPKEAVESYRIATYDNGFSAYLLPIISQIRREAPHVDLEVCFVPPHEELADALSKNQIQLVIHPFPPKSAAVISVPLTPMDYVLLVRKEHPLVSQEAKEGALTRDDLRPYSQVMPGARAFQYRPWLDLQAQGLPSITQPYFNASPFIALHTDAFVWMPEPTARHWLQFEEFRIVRPPKDCQCTFTPQLFWHRRYNLDPLHQWMRSMIIGSAKNPD